MHTGKRKEILFSVYIVLVLFFLCPLPSHCETMRFYVVPKAEVPIRSGKGTGYKIIRIVKEGTPVSLIEEGGSWAKVRLEDGTEGWIIRRYLSGEEPPLMRLKALQKRLEAKSNEVESLSSRLKVCKDDHSRCESELEVCQSQKDDLLNRYTLLQEDSKNVVTLKKNYDAQQLELERLNKDISILRQENTDLKKDQSVRWFLAGTGVLLLGWLIGFSLGRRQKRRSSTLL